MSRKLLVASLAASIGVAALIALRLERQTIYSYDVSGFLSKDVREERVRIEGALVPGSLCTLEPDCGYRFELRDRFWPRADGSSTSDRRPSLPIAFEGCVMPDPFFEHGDQELDVVVQGERCQTCHDFQATDIMTRSFGKYELANQPEATRLPPLPRCDALTPRM